MSLLFTLSNFLLLPAKVFIVAMHLLDQLMNPIHEMQVGPRILFIESLEDVVPDRRQTRINEELLDLGRYLTQLLDVVVLARRALPQKQLELLDTGLRVAQVLQQNIIAVVFSSPE